MSDHKPTSLTVRIWTRDDKVCYRIHAYTENGTLVDAEHGELIEYSPLGNLFREWVARGDEPDDVPILVPRSHTETQ